MAVADIIIVDDNAANLKLLELALRGDAHTVRQARDAIQAEALIASAAPELILMDLQLPGVDGLTLTRRLKADARTRHIPVVAVTSYSMEGDEERARAAGCDGYISKPIDTRALPAMVRGFVLKR